MGKKFEHKYFISEEEKRKIRKLHKEEKLGPKALAERFGVTSSTIQKILKGGKEV